MWSIGFRVFPIVFAVFFTAAALGFWPPEVSAQGRFLDESSRRLPSGLGGAVAVAIGDVYDGIDIAETLSNLTGKWIKRISADSVEFEDGEVVDTKNLDWKRIKPLIWW